MVKHIHNSKLRIPPGETLSAKHTLREREQTSKLV